MKLFALSTIAACATVALASPAGQMNLAKRANDATHTLIADGKMYIEIIEGVQATVFGTQTVTQTVTETATDYSYVFEYTGDDQDIIGRLQEILSGVFGDSQVIATSSEDPSTTAEETSTGETSTTFDDNTSIPSFVTGIIVPTDISQPVDSPAAPFSFITGIIVPSTAFDATSSSA